MISSLLKLASPNNIPKVFRQLEQEMETVMNVLQPGPLGIIEHKFSAEEVQKAKSTVERAIENWRSNAAIEKSGRANMKDPATEFMGKV